MAEGQERQEPLALAEAVGGGNAAQRPHDVGVADHGPLGRAARAARIDDGGQVLGPDQAGPFVHRVGVAGEPVGTQAPQLVDADDEAVGGPPGPVGQDHPLQGGQLVADLEHLAQLGVGVDEAHRDPGVAEHVGHLGRRARRVDGHRHGAVQHRAVVGQVPLHLVGRQDADDAAPGPTPSSARPPATWPAAARYSAQVMTSHSPAPGPSPRQRRMAG